MANSLVKYFKANPVLDLDIGPFAFEADLGQGGNAKVLKFKRGEHPFAIKFIPHAEGVTKLHRFRDEFFGAAQIPTHENVVMTYHYDTKHIDGEDYSLIVMKAYDSTLHKIAPINGASIDEQSERAWKLFTDLCNGLKHLHTKHIIHRDIKPQNIFFDQNANTFVIGDLGIAHFKEEEFAKLAHTKPTDRMANYLFSAPEQVDSKNEITPAADIYSLGQVMQWFLTGATVRGQGRTSFASGLSTSKLSILDAINNRALRDKPAERYQSIDEIFDAVKAIKSMPAPWPDPWPKIHAFDEVIRRSFPSIDRVHSTVDHSEIKTFLTTFQHECKPTDFWYMFADGGDNTFQSLEHVGRKNWLSTFLRRGENRKWLFNGMDEMSIIKLLVHEDSGAPYKNFFILLIGPDEPFDIRTPDGKKVVRTVNPTWDRDYATLVDNKFYIDSNKIRNGYVNMGGKSIPVTRDRFKDRIRYIKPFGLIVVPTETASASMSNRLPTQKLIQSSIVNLEIQEQDLKLYLNATRAHHSRNILQYT